MDLSFQSYLFYSAKLSLIYLCYLGISYLFMPNVMGKTHYNVLKVILMGFLIPFRPSLEFNLFGQDVTQWAGIVPMEIPLQQNNLVQPLTNGALQQIANNQTVNFSAEQIWMVLFVVWILGVLFRFVYSIIKYRDFLKTVRRWCYIDESLEQYLEKIKKDLNIREEIKIYTCTFTETPILYGFFNTTILIPETLKDDKRVDLYIKHELVHHKRKDIWLKLLAFFVGSIQWFNPIVKHMLKRFELVCEISCDEEVNKKNSLEEQKLYAKMVLSLAQHKNINNMVILTQFNGGKNDMEKRIISIMKPKKKRGLFAIIASISFVLMTNSTFGSTNPGKLEVYKDVKQGIEISVYDTGIFKTMSFIKTDDMTKTPTVEEALENGAEFQKAVRVNIAIKDLTGNRIEEVLKEKSFEKIDIKNQDFEMKTLGADKVQKDLSNMSDTAFYSDKSRAVESYNSKTKTAYMFLADYKVDINKENFTLTIKKLTLNDKTEIEGNWVFDLPMPKEDKQTVNFANYTFEGNNRNLTTKVSGSNSMFDLSIGENVVGVGLTLKQGDTVKLGDENIVITYNNGKKINLKNLYTNYTQYGDLIGRPMAQEGYIGAYVATYQTLDEKIDVAQVKSVTINGVEININKLNVLKY